MNGKLNSRFCKRKCSLHNHCTVILNDTSSALLPISSQ